MLLVRTHRKLINIQAIYESLKKCVRSEGIHFPAFECVKVCQYISSEQSLLFYYSA